jgi:hypothetical protein
MASVGLTTVVWRLFVQGSSGIPGLQSQTVDAADADPLPPAEVVPGVAVDEHEAARKEAASSPATAAASRQTWRFAADPDRQVTCISLMTCSVPLDSHERKSALPIR